MNLENFLKLANKLGHTPNYVRRLSYSAGYKISIGQDNYEVSDTPDLDEWSDKFEDILGYLIEENDV